MRFEDKYYSFESAIAQPPTPVQTPRIDKFSEPDFGILGTDPKSLETRARDVSSSNYRSLEGSRSPNIPLIAFPREQPSTSNSSAFQDITTHKPFPLDHFSTPSHRGLAPVDAIHRLPSSLEPAFHATLQNNIKQDTEYLPSCPPMQTPPPTAISQEKAQILHRVPSSDLAMADPQKLSTPKLSRAKPTHTPGRGFDVSPQVFTHLQFSPDLFQYGMSGPATAPVLPQSRLFWEADPVGGEHDSNTLDPFFHSQGTAATYSASSPVLPKALSSLTGPQSHATFGMSTTNGAPYNVLSSPTQLDGSSFPAPFTASPRVPTTRAEDPSLFLSSPARRFGPVPQPSTSLPAPQVSRQPYHHQIEESKREEASIRSRKAKGKSPNEDPGRQRQRPSSPISRPGIKRSVTHTGVGNPERHARRQNYALLSNSAGHVDLHSRPSSTGGRVSPLKRNSQQAGLDRPPSRPRGSLTLTIDESGRAKTVFTAGPETQDSKMSLDDEVSESDGSDDSADFNFVNSRNTSFAYSETGLTMPKPNYLRPESKSHSKNSSYSSTHGSSNSTNFSSRTSSLQTTINLRPFNHNASTKDVVGYGDRVHQNYRGSSLATVQSSQPSSIFENEEEDLGDAQGALRALKKDRSRKMPGNLVWSESHENSLSSFPSSPPVQANAFDAYLNNNIISPTTITDPDLATPSTDRESSSSGITRCVCNSAEHWGHMIQCESCSKWLHTQCVGLDPDRIPPVYVCVYCVQTPMRHGRLREPSRVVTMAPASPLARKSGRPRK